MRARILTLGSAFALTGCFQTLPTEVEIEPDEESLEWDGSMVQTFELAAEQTGVPRDLLLAMAWHESSFVPHAQHDDEMEHRPAHGIMGMTPERVQEAADITGASLESIEEDLHTNIRAAAAVLNELREDLSPDAPADHVSAAWWPVVSAWPAYGEDWMDDDYARDVFRTLQLGLEANAPDGEAITLAARRLPGLEDVDFIAPPQGAEERNTGYPQRDRWYPASSGNQSSRSNGVNSIQRVVIHTTEGSYNGAISWFRNNSSNVSAHYVIRKSDGEVTQMVSDARKAWHACSNNNDTIGIEHEGSSYNSSTWTSAMLDSSARLTAWLVNEYDIPIDRDHIVGHGEIQPSHCAGRSDPGPYFPWSQYLDMVATYAGQSVSNPTPPPTPPSTGTSGPLTFLSPQDGDSVGNSVDVSVQHPQSHIELWSGPALLVPYIYDSPAEYTVEFNGSGSRNLTARAYRLSGSHVATKSIWVNVGGPPQPDPEPEPEPEPDPEPAPGTAELYSAAAVGVGGSTVQFTASASAGISRVEYWIDGWRLPDDDTGSTSGTGSNHELVYTFNYTGERNLQVRGYLPSGALADTIEQTIDVDPASDPAGCPADVCVDAFPYSTSGNTIFDGTPDWDSYSCAPSISEAGPEVVYAIDVPYSGTLTVSVSDAADVDIDVHILTAMDPNSCVARGHHSASAWVTGGTTVYVSADSWMDSNYIVWSGAYDLDITIN